MTTTGLLVRAALAGAAVLTAVVLMEAGARADTASATLSVPHVTQAPPAGDDAGDAAWKAAATATLGYDVQNHRSATQHTTAYIMTDGTYAYVGFVAQQSVPVVATQRTNDVGEGADDQVEVDFWPGGSSGFHYSFISNPIGTHYQTSSENTSYAPTWWSTGKITSGGYSVTMKIPLDVMRGITANGSWKAQFVRDVQSTGEQDVWSYGAAQTKTNDVVYAGTLTGFSAAKARNRARLQVYNLGEIASPSIGGSTARTGMDLSLPITPTASFVATLHPDYSDVEIDQQTISPTAFRRSFSEVRPFFTQLSNFYNAIGCNVCNFYTSLYTPAIPTPRDGFAVEGKQGPLNVGAFNAIGVNRDDSAYALTYDSPDRKWTAFAQHVGVSMPNLKDDAVDSGISYSDNKHWYAYAKYATDSGTNVLVPDQAQQYEAGASWYNPTTVFATAVRKIGAYYNPVDGFASFPGIAGYGAYAAKSILWDKRGRPKSVSVSFFGDRYHAQSGALNQTDNNLDLDVLTRNLFDINVSSGSSYLLLPNGVFSPVTQNGIGLTYHSGSATSANNPGGQHGLGATPTSVAFNTGRFGPGRLISWMRSSTLRVGNRGLLTLEADDTDQHLDAGTRYTQWLERAAYTYQSGPDSSFAFGVRRTIGTPPELDIVPVFVSGWNLSAAYHVKMYHDEFYAVYGDANAFSTAPGFIVKWIHYFGAGKGT